MRGGNCKWCTAGTCSTGCINSSKRVDLLTSCTTYWLHRHGRETAKIEFILRGCFCDYRRGWYETAIAVPRSRYTACWADYLGSQNSEPLASNAFAKALLPD